MAGNGIELGKAYVQIIPSAEGIQGKITEVLGGEAASAGESAGQLLGAQLVGTLKKVLSAAAIGKAIADSINAGGALQQSVGGVETLFKDSADTVKAYAAQAYRTAGLSANDYMEATTSFAASLLSSVSKDTEAAAQLANMAMVDMSDNANKMGTDMASIQNAYQGFAKQNYTMLDNLKLGYGGTQAEMQRLLQDAEKISGVHYDLGNLADMYSAIHIIQEQLDITGTTAKEASTTLTGSFASMGAAFQNVLGSIALGEDLAPSLEALMETARTYLVDNLLPMVVNVAHGIPAALMEVVPEFLAQGTEMVRSLGSGFLEGVPEFLSSALPALLSFTEELRANFGDFVSAGIDLILNLLNGIIEGLPQLFAYVPEIIINLAGLINDNAPKLLAGGVALIVSLARGLIQSIPLLVQNAGKIVEAILAVISAFNWLNLGANILKGIANGVKSMGSGLLNAFKSGFSGALNWIKSLPSQAVQWGKNLIQSFINGITGKGGAASIATAAAQVAKTAAQDIPEWSLSDEVADKAEANALRIQNLSKAVETTIPTYTKSGTAAATAATAATKAATAAKQAAATVVSSLKTSGEKLVNGIRTTTETTKEILSDGTERMKQVVTTTKDEIVEGALKTVEEVRTIAADGTETVARTIKESSATTFSGLWKEIQSEADNGVLGTFGTLFTAVKNKDWSSIGQWAVSTLFNGLSDDRKLQIKTFALNLVQQLNGELGGAMSQISATAWSLGEEIVNGVTGSFGEIITQANVLGDSLQTAFTALKGPLGAAAQSISQALSGGLLSNLPAIYAGFASMIGTVGAAMETMLASISAALSATVAGIPLGAIVAAAAVALGVAIAAICASLGSSKKSSPVSKPSSSGSANSAVFDTGALLWDYEKASAEPARKPRPSVEVNQYIYSKAQTAADLMREAQYEQERAVLQGV